VEICNCNGLGGDVVVRGDAFDLLMFVTSVPVVTPMRSILIWLTNYRNSNGSGLRDPFTLLTKVQLLHSGLNA
jgi:hypothetical protein